MVDLKKWEVDAKLPDYDPPQIKPKWLTTCHCINWYGKRSPWFPCFNKVCLCCLCSEQILLTDEKTWVPQMLKSIHPRCPNELKGIYWLRDHIQALTLLTFHDCDWSNPQKTRRNLNSNWVKANTTWGVLSTVQSKIGSCFYMDVEFAPSGNWIYVTFYNLKVYWMYLFTKNTVLTRKSDGKKIQVYKGDLMRINFEKWNDPSSKVLYMYLLQRIIVPSSNGTYSKTKTYNEFISQVNKKYIEPYFQSTSIIKYDTVMSAQHTSSFSPSYMERN